MIKSIHAITWKDILYLLIISLVAVSCTGEKRHTDHSQAPNILLIFTDQQNVNMMSATGNPYLQTPAMDRLAGKGMMFLHGYCTSPVCGPARSSIISGRMPHETGVEWNGDKMTDQVVNAGEIFRKAGYKTVWAGKWHLPESYPQRDAARDKEIRGFDLLPFHNPAENIWMLGAETDPPLTGAVVDFINGYSGEKPFFLAVSYHNPYDICFYPRKAGWFTEADSLLEIRYYGFDYKLPDVIGTHPDFIQQLPPLPPNFEIPEPEPEFIRTKRREHNEYGLETKLANSEFGEKEWRGYYHAYCRLTEMVDREIDKVINALEAKGYDKNTLIVFTSDHGDGAASHRWAAKLSLYEESSRIPFILTWPGQIPAGRVDQQHLVSQIDILPTLCDFAGISPEVTFTGRSLRPVIDNPDTAWREYIVVELADFKPDPARKGRMVRSQHFKYNVYNQGKHNEQLFDLRNDPGETLNLASEPLLQEIKMRHRMYLRDWLLATGDNF
jgi:arylsulfatase A-like enzyme